MMRVTRLDTSEKEADQVQGFPFAPGAAGTPTQGVPQVPAPGFPPGVAPSITQMPAAPMTGFPPIFRTPGPTALGPAPTGQTGPQIGVPGVAMAPVNGLTPPAATGGPHPLPGLPTVPLPQGFPNPFTVQQVVPQNQAPSTLPQAPGTTTVTGPAGYMPGLGYFGAPAPTSFPVLPGAIPQGQAAPAPGPAPLAPAPAAASPAPPPPQAAQPHPFWVNLAWQLLQTPAVAEALGEQFRPLVEGDERQRTLQAAVACLAGQELQTAFRALTSGQLLQTRFTELFAESLKAMLQAVPT